MKPTFRAIFGSFRLLRARAEAERVPSLAVWTDTGEQATAAVQARVRDGAHKAEIAARSIAATVAEITADGVVTGEELRRLQNVPTRANRVAEICHDVGEVTS
jgi:hypothetical protein